MTESLPRADVAENGFLAGAVDRPLEREYLAELGELVELAAAICETPLGLVTVLDGGRQRYLAAVGVPLEEVPAELSFCIHALQQQQLMMVEDAATDPRFCDNPLVRDDPRVRFYAGFPLTKPGNAGAGTLCVLDHVPRRLNASQRKALRTLARQVQGRMELRARRHELERALEANVALTETLRASNSAFESFMHHGPFASYIKDSEGRMIFYNQTLAERFGVDRKAWLGKLDAELWPEAMAREFRQADLAVLTERKAMVLEEETPDGQGGVTLWRSYKFPLCREDGTWLLGGISLDVTQEMERKAALVASLQLQKEQLEELEVSRKLMVDFNESSPNLTWVKTQEGCYLSYNRAFAEHFSIGEKDWLGKTDYEVLPEPIAEGFYCHDQEVLRRREAVEMRDHYRLEGGERRTFRCIRFPLRGEAKEELIAGLAINITRETKEREALKETNAQLSMLASTDGLTGLANRRVFDQRMSAEYGLAEKKMLPISLLMMDLDDFKRRNDRFGHGEGDVALKTLGRILMGLCRPGDLAGRMGGEEFALLMPRTGAREAQRRALAIQRALAAEQFAAGPLTVSIGVAARDLTTRTWGHLLATADEAMYAAKRSGKNRAVVHPQGSVGMVTGGQRSGEWGGVLA